MSDGPRHRRAARRAVIAARRSAAELGGHRVRFDLVLRTPGESEERSSIASPARLLAELRATAMRVAEAARATPTSDGTTLTLVGRVPRRTPAGGTTWDSIHLCQMLYSGGSWWQSVNGRDWRRCSETGGPYAAP